MGLRLEMKKFLCLIVLLTVCVISESFANASVVINPNQNYSNVINIDESTTIENNGVLNSDVYVCPRCLLYVKNTGVINSKFYLGDGAKIIQVISDSSHVNKIDFGTNYIVHLESGDAVSVAAISNVASGADKVVVRDSVLDLSDGKTDSLPPMEFYGAVKLIVSGINSTDDVLLLHNVTGNGTVYVVDAQNNPMYSRTVYYNGGDLYLKGMRETNYDKILGKDTADLIDSLKEQDPDNPLFENMDSVRDKNELNNLLSRSIYFNPDVLFDALRIVNALDITSVSDKVEGFSVAPFGILSDDFYLYGVGINLAGNITDKFNMDLGLRMARMEFKNSFNDFENTMYGANLTLNYNSDYGVFIRAMVSAYLSRLSIDKVVYNGDVINNPRAASGVMLIDFGYKVNLDDSFYIAPFIGGTSELYMLDNINKTDTRFRTGVGMGYVFDALGIRYDYNLRVAADMKGDVGLNLQIAAMSEMDAIGGDINLSAAYVMDMLNYMATVKVKFLF